MNKLKEILLQNEDIIINYETSSYFIKIINENVIRIGEIKALDYKSYAAKENIKKLEININKNIITFANKKIIVHDNFLLDIYENDVLISSDQNEMFHNVREHSELLELEGHKAMSNDDYEFMVCKKLNKDDLIYGLGDKTGFLNKRGYEYINWNTDDPSPHCDNFKSLYKSIPFFMVINKNSYGIFLDNTYKSIFNFGQYKNDLLFYGSTGGYLNYYFFFGNIKSIIKEYTNLTGRCPLPQRRSLGYHQSRWSYKTREEVLELANNFIKNKIPLECIHLDIDYMENYKVFTTSNEKFPNIKEMINELKDKGIKIVTIIDPGVKAENGYFVYEEGLKNNYFATKDNKVYHNAVWPGDSVFPAFTNKDVRKWWGDLTKHVSDLGIMGIWNDMNEPASFNGPIELDVEFSTGNTNIYHKEAHNIYGHLMAEATYDGLKKNTNMRPFVITRACYAGSQKYTTAWTGDNHSIWSHIELAIPQLCNLGLSGMPYCGTDIGGFGFDCTKELLIRWIQLGIFSPLCRNHSAYGTRRQEPWTFDDETVEIYRKFVNLRYRLIPYMYDLFYNHQSTGLPMNRPLILEYPNDPNVKELNDEFMLGENILVAPITIQGQTKKMVYLPEGKWICFNTNKIYEGNKYYIVDAKIDTCPIFIKYNSIIPMYTSTNIENPEEIEFVCYGESGTYTHYQDNGLDFNFENGEYNIYDVSFNKEVSVKLQTNNYKEYKNIKTTIIRGL